MSPLRGLAAELGLWLVFAALLLAPTSLTPFTALLGDPRIDVWNHAWGYWFVAEQLLRGELPYDTTLVGGPDGGVLYFIDTPGALAALPVTLLLGPAAAYNLTLLMRVALSGFAARRLAAELGGDGPHTVIAGLAYASTPFLLCELANGISEVCATQWLAFTLWMAARAFRTGERRDWLLLGLLQGLTSVTTFYYGLCSAALVLSAALVWRLHAARVEGWRAFVPRSLLVNGLLASAAGLLLIAPHWLVFRASLSDPRALILRDPRMNLQLMAHNAVDPRVFVTPGDFQSVRLAELYGEPFVHTGYLRLSVIALAIWGAVRLTRLRPWLGLALWSLVLGLGPFLWWGGDWVKLGDNLLSLPFDWIRRVLPQVAITHPLRLSLGAQALFAALAAGGAQALAARWPDRGRLVLGLVAAVVVAEGLFGSAARWPIPSADATLPAVYDDAGDGMVLELPVEVGTGMLTSRYFWSQTAHGRPIPFTPDVRMGSTRDSRLVRALAGDPRQGGVMKDNPSPLSAEAVQHIRGRYSLIVLNLELEREAGLEGRYAPVLGAAFGEPERDGDRLIWRLRP
ncbi:hypothetical protein L6R49_26545 [Myxococcota bacterium]|nr:hypothetical protein [Myxococcota bacterium]